MHTGVQNKIARPTIQNDSDKDTTSAYTNESNDWICDLQMEHQPLVLTYNNDNTYVV